MAISAMSILWYCTRTLASRNCGKYSYNRLEKPLMSLFRHRSQRLGHQLESAVLQNGLLKHNQTVSIAIVATLWPRLILATERQRSHCDASIAFATKPAERKTPKHCSPEPLAEKPQTPDT